MKSTQYLASKEASQHTAMFIIQQEKVLSNVIVGTLHVEVCKAYAGDYLIEIGLPV